MSYIKKICGHANFGIEREGLRVTPEGELALTPHPKAFGEQTVKSVYHH